MQITIGIACIIIYMFGIEDATCRASRGGTKWTNVASLKYGARCVNQSSQSTITRGCSNALDNKYAKHNTACDNGMFSGVHQDRWFPPWYTSGEDILGAFMTVKFNGTYRISKIKLMQICDPKNLIKYLQLTADDGRKQKVGIL